MEFLRDKISWLLVGGAIIAGCGPPSPIILDESGLDGGLYQTREDFNQSSYVPISFSTGARLEWVKSFNQRLNVEPSAAFGTIMVPTVDHFLYLISGNSGLSIAKKKYKEAIIAPVVISDSTAAIIIEGNRLIVENWVLYQTKWEADLGSSFMAPLIVENKIYWHDGLNYVRCFNLEDGKRVWDRKLEDFCSAPLSGSAGGIFATSDLGVINCFNPISGDMVWSYDTGGRMRNAPIVVEKNLIFCTSEGIVYRLNSQNGMKIWETDLNSPVRASLAVDSEGVYIGTNNRYIYKLDYQTGDPVWNRKIGGPIKAGPIIMENLAVFVGIDYKVYFVDKNNGKIVFEYLTEGMLTTRPVACDGKVYIAGEDKNLYCFNITGDE